MPDKTEQLVWIFLFTFWACSLFAAGKEVVEKSSEKILENEGNASERKYLVPVINLAGNPTYSHIIVERARYMKQEQKHRMESDCLKTQSKQSQSLTAKGKLRSKQVHVAKTDESKTRTKQIMVVAPNGRTRSKQITVVKTKDGKTKQVQVSKTGRRGKDGKGTRMKQGQSKVLHG
ncbi:unnamed protein product [Clavelina lepadiformis]|uniref:Secreted protein n=1 Tax=Clavelina lepadiformis TaxID=159417 RepID=A0ABP0FAR0_CLALP